MLMFPMVTFFFFFKFFLFFAAHISSANMCRMMDMKDAAQQQDSYQYGVQDDPPCYWSNR